MKIEFYKYHGTGNDFVLFDARLESFPYHRFSEREIRAICHRRFGIGADGVIFLRLVSGYDFYMDYYNSDGKVSSMCGNGSRCLVRLASDLGLIKERTFFQASDGDHIAKINGQTISVKMNAGEARPLENGDVVINTGSPHYVKFVNDLKLIDVVREGRAIRNSAAYKDEGINVNFVEVMDDLEIKMATYERGVEDETYSCGTGVTASALSLLDSQGKKEGIVDVATKGGRLSVKVQTEASAREIWLNGPADFVFKGELDLDDFVKVYE